LNYFLCIDFLKRYDLTQSTIRIRRLIEQKSGYKMSSYTSETGMPLHHKALQRPGFF